MLIAVLLGVTATFAALMGLLGRKSAGDHRVSEIVVYALPLGIIGAGYAASIGINLTWAIVAAISVFLAILAGGMLRRQPALTDPDIRPAAAGLSLVCSAMISLGLGAIAMMWAIELITAFSYLDGFVVTLVLVIAAVAYAIGGRSAIGMSRTVMLLLIVGAIAMLGVGLSTGGDTAGLFSPQVPVPSLNPALALLYGIGIVIIGAGYPLMRSGDTRNRGRVVIAALVVTLTSFVIVLGILITYGGAFQLPSLVINIFPVYAPPLLAGLICGLAALISTVVAGATIHAAGVYLAEMFPSRYSEQGGRTDRPRYWLSMAIGLLLLIVVFLAPQPPETVLLLAVLAAANLIAEWTISRAIRRSAADPVESVDAARDPGTSAAATQRNNND